MEDDLQTVKNVLQHYSLVPRFTESYGKVKKVYTNKGVFALKKITPKYGIDFVRQIQLLYQRGYNRIVPIYPTFDGKYAVMYGNSLYYLMPWLPNEMKENIDERHKHLFRELARLHTLSIQEVPINKEHKEQFFTNTISEWEKEEEFLEGFLERCEQQIYMSPYELLFCLYYNDIYQALQFSKRKLTEWNELTEEMEKGRMVLAHGKISTEHFIYDERGYGYFTNFEKSRYGSPIHDLLPFISRFVYTYPKRCEECVDWVYIYMKYFPLKEEEITLFLCYLAYPGKMIREVERFFHLQKKNERLEVLKLQKQYWRLKNIEYIVMRIDEIEKQKKLEKSKEEGTQSE